MGRRTWLIAPARQRPPRLAIALRIAFNRSRPKRARYFARAACRRATAAAVHASLSMPGHSTGFAQLCVLLATASTRCQSPTRVAAKA